MNGAAFFQKMGCKLLGCCGGQSIPSSTSTGFESDKCGTALIVSDSCCCVGFGSDKFWAELIASPGASANLVDDGLNGVAFSVRDQILATGKFCSELIIASGGSGSDKCRAELIITSAGFGSDKFWAEQINSWPHLRQAPGKHFGIPESVPH